MRLNMQGFQGGGGYLCESKWGELGRLGEPSDRGRDGGRGSWWALPRWGI